MDYLIIFLKINIYNEDGIIFMEQFLRTQLLLGKEKFQQIQNAKITIVGLGAVGGAASEVLARAGVGSLTLVDFDKIKITNLNRQILAVHSTINKPKVDAAKERIRDINPKCKVETFELFASSETMQVFLGSKPDLLIDAIDSLNPKVELLSYCRKNNIPVISSMGAALRTDPFSIKIGDLFKTHACPLAYCVRKYLRKRGIKDGITCVYSTQLPQGSVFNPDEFNEKDNFERGRKRKVLGSLPTITGIFGFMIAHGAIQFFTDTEFRKKYFSK